MSKASKDKAPVAEGLTETKSNPCSVAETQRPLILFVGGRNIEVDIDAALSVPPENHPHQLARVSALHQAALHEERRLETELEAWHATKACAVRQDVGDGRITEKNIESQAKADPEYLALQTALNDAAYRRGLLWSVLHALNARTAILSRGVAEDGI